MSSAEEIALTCKIEINASIEHVWKLWTTPMHIMQWNNTSEEWHTPKAENDLRPGGKLRYEM